MRNLLLGLLCTASLACGPADADVSAHLRKEILAITVPLAAESLRNQGSVYPAGVRAFLAEGGHDVDSATVRDFACQRLAGVIGEADECGDLHSLATLPGVPAEEVRMEALTRLVTLRCPTAAVAVLACSRLPGQYLESRVLGHLYQVDMQGHETELAQYLLWNYARFSRASMRLLREAPDRVGSDVYIYMGDEVFRPALEAAVKHPSEELLEILKQCLGFELPPGTKKRLQEATDQVAKTISEKSRKTGDH